MQMVPAGAGGKAARISGRGGGGGGRLLSRLNPFAPLQRLVGRLREGQQLSKKVQQRAAALSGEPASTSSSSSTTNKSAGDGAAGPAASGSPAPPQQQQQQQYSLQDLPARRLLASGTPPQLAWVPLRVALQLLKSVPQHFVLLAHSPPPPQQQPAEQQQPGSKAGKQLLQQQPGGGAAPGGSPFSGSKLGSDFSTVTSPAGLEVHIIPVSGPYGPPGTAGGAVLQAALQIQSPAGSTSPLRVLSCHCLPCLPCLSCLCCPASPALCRACTCGRSLLRAPASSSLLSSSHTTRQAAGVVAPQRLLSHSCLTGWLVC